MDMMSGGTAPSHGPQSHRIIDYNQNGLEGTLKAIQFQPLVVKNFLIISHLNIVSFSLKSLHLSLFYTP